jgi:uncharacterized protein (DUF433 family)
MTQISATLVYMEKGYVEQRNGGYYLTDSRVSLESIILAFLDGLSPETIATECFPTLTLEQVYGAITYYLANRESVNHYLENLDTEFKAFQETNKQTLLFISNLLEQSETFLLTNDKSSLSSRC